MENKDNSNDIKFTFTELEFVFRLKIDDYKKIPDIVDILSEKLGYDILRSTTHYILLIPDRVMMDLRKYDNSCIREIRPVFCVGPCYRHSKCSQVLFKSVNNGDSISVYKYEPNTDHFRIEENARYQLIKNIDNRVILRINPAYTYYFEDILSIPDIDNCIALNGLFNTIFDNVQIEFNTYIQHYKFIISWINQNHMYEGYEYNYNYNPPLKTLINPEENK